MTRVILWLCLAVVCNLGSDIRTLDNCHTDTECAEAAARKCASGDAFYCESEEGEMKI